MKDITPLILRSARHVQKENFTSLPYASESRTGSTIGVDMAVFTLRWYLRIVGVVLIGYACLLIWEKHPSAVELWMNEGPLLLLSGTGILGSFGMRGAWVMSLISLFISLCGGTVLFGGSISTSLISTIIATGLDQQRAQLIAALLLTAATAFLGATGGQRKFGASVGAGIVFWFGYLDSFIQLELQPTHDPGGNLEPLNSGALVHMSCVMLALALLSAFLGAAVGIAFGQVIFTPLSHLGQITWHRLAHNSVASISQRNGVAEQLPIHSRSVVGSMVISWLSAAMMIVLLILASSSSDLFMFSPDVGLHSVPTIYHGQSMPTHGTVVHESMVSLALGGQSKSFLVYLPPSYNTSQGQNKRYPTLYLLHGSPGSARDWFIAGKADQSADTLIALGKIPELILISPDGNGRAGETSEWGNSFDQRQRIESYITVDLVKYVDQKYRTHGQSVYRGIGGLSMGGFGAMNIAVRHPDVFGTVISLGGYYHAEGSIWGGNAIYMRANSPADVFHDARQAWKLHMYLGAAMNDEPYYTYTKQFAQELDTLALQYHLDAQKGYHAWTVWQTQMYNALLWLHWG